MSDHYCLLFKSAQAERRAWQNMHEERKKCIFPIIELTRGRKNPPRKGDDGKKIIIPEEELSTTANAYGFHSNCKKTLELMSECDKFILDLTREPSLACFEIDQFSQSENGYSNWIEYLTSLDAVQQKIIPTLIVNPSESDTQETYEDNLNAQFQKLSELYGNVAYRISVLYDSEFIYDLVALKENILKSLGEGNKFYVILDHEYIRPFKGSLHADRTNEIIAKIKSELPDASFISVATSFPKDVTDIGEEDFGNFPVEEMLLYDAIKSKHEDVLYGDYGSINPIRNDEIIITQGWRPRIDFVSNLDQMHTYYYREQRREVGQKEIEDKKNGGRKLQKIRAPYAEHYASVANSVIKHKTFQNLNFSWGCREIQKASEGKVPSNAPSHWISVRMEIHMIQVLKKFFSDPLEG